MMATLMQFNGWSTKIYKLTNGQIWRHVLSYHTARWKYCAYNHKNNINKVVIEIWMNAWMKQAQKHHQCKIKIENNNNQVT